MYIPTVNLYATHTHTNLPILQVGCLTPCILCISEVGCGKTKLHVNVRVWRMLLYGDVISYIVSLV